MGRHGRPVLWVWLNSARPFPEEVAALVAEKLAMFHFRRDGRVLRCADGPERCPIPGKTASAWTTPRYWGWTGLWRALSVRRRARPHRLEIDVFEGDPINGSNRKLGRDGGAFRFLLPALLLCRIHARQQQPQLLGAVAQDSAFISLMKAVQYPHQCGFASTVFPSSACTSPRRTSKST